MNHLEAGLLILRALEEGSARRATPLTRGRFSKLALRLLLGRRYNLDITRLNEILEPTGWILMFDSKAYVGALRLSVIEDWPRVTTSALDKELAKIDDNAFDFDTLEYLLSPEFWKTEKANKGEARKGKRKTK